MTHLDIIADRIGASFSFQPETIQAYQQACWLHRTTHHVAMGHSGESGDALPFLASVRGVKEEHPQVFAFPTEQQLAQFWRCISSLALPF